MSSRKTTDPTITRVSQGSRPQYFPGFSTSFIGLNQPQERYRNWHWHDTKGPRKRVIIIPMKKL